MSDAITSNPISLLRRAMPFIVDAAHEWQERPDHEVHALLREMEIAVRDGHAPSCASLIHGKPCNCKWFSDETKSPRTLSAVDRLYNICDALSEQADDSPFTREEWERVDKQTAEHIAEIAGLRAANAQLLDELHHHFGCDSECEKRHAVKSEARLTHQPAGPGLQYCKHHPNGRSMPCEECS